MASLVKQNYLELSTGVKLDFELLKKSSLFLRAINHPLRQRMLEVIDSEPKITVTKIYIKLRLEQSVASQHLAILRNAGFVLAQRNGKYIHYSLNNDRLSQAKSLVESINL
jgi:DNA-binding transcriptional ArsR family regulator